MAHALKNTHTTIEYSLFWAVLFALIFSLFSYGYFLSSAIHNVFSRSSAAKEATNLSNSIADLENRAIALQSEVTLEKAFSLGFDTAPDPLFVTRGTFSKGITLNPLQ